jgi:hypothetical protein
LRKAGKFDAIIEAAKENVRNACAIPYRWSRLFSAFVEAQRYTEAVQTLHEMAGRGIPLPFAALSRSAPEFLTSKEFQDSTVGFRYETRKLEIDRLMQGAEAKLGAMNSSDLPPPVYESKGACPFECCTYREWKTNKPVELVESIGSATVVAGVAAGVDVRGVTGEVHIEPRPYVALEDIGQLKAGDVIFLLDSRGEGHFNYWYNGELEPELGFEEGLAMYSYESCQINSGKGSCSLRQLHPEKKYRNDWWVRIRTSDGKEGWTLNTGQFDNIDACG